MSDNYPDLAKLVANANNPNISWEDFQPETSVDASPPESEPETEVDLKETMTSGNTSAATVLSSLPSADLEQYWQQFIDILENKNFASDKSRRVFCQLDRDIVDSLDECDLYGCCRSDIVNTIVRVFFEMFLPRLADYKRERKSFFNTLKST